MKKRNSFVSNSSSQSFIPEVLRIDKFILDMKMRFTDSFCKYGLDMFALRPYKNMIFTFYGFDAKYAGIIIVQADKLSFKQIEFNFQQDSIKDNWVNITGEKITVFQNLNPTTDVSAPQNNDGRSVCFWCQKRTKEIQGFTSSYNICEDCGK